MNSKMILGSVLMGAALVSTPSMAIDYVGGGLAMQSVDIPGASIDDGWALVANLGAKIPAVDGLGWEAEVTKSLVKPEYSETYFGNDVTVKFDFYSVAGFATYTYEATPEFFVRPKVGLIYAGGKSDVEGSESETSSGLGLALELGYKLSDSLALTFGYTPTVFDKDSVETSHMAFGVSFSL